MCCLAKDPDDVNPWVPICFELFSVFPGAKNMFAQCVGILASSLTSRRIRLVMGGVGEVTCKFSRLEKTLAILFQQRGQKYFQ